MLNEIGVVRSVISRDRESGLERLVRGVIWLQYSHEYSANRKPIMTIIEFLKANDEVPMLPSIIQPMHRTGYERHTGGTSP
jgi:hypothetical protein